MLNLKHLASHAYRQYELVTCINMLEPWERKLISEYRKPQRKPISNPYNLNKTDGFFLFMLALVIFSSFMYLPDYLHTLLQFITPTTWHSSPENAAYVAQKMARS
ncbi:hypothetical protein KR084_004501 [Drosophila pseudotakahashii]|nr:hypothetical protein KR084_004501 [Drosophila pseudotakahashii]